MAVTAQGTSSYLFDGVANPVLTVVRGCSYTFQVNANFHPFFIKTIQGSGMNNQYEEGVTGQGIELGDVEWTVADDTPDVLFYNCGNHDLMTNQIDVID